MRTLLSLAAAATLVGAAHAQVFYAIEVGGASNWRLDVATGASVGPVWNAGPATGLADDDAAQVLYIGHGSTLSTADYAAPGGMAQLLGTTTYMGAPRSFTGLAAHGGVLYGSHNAGTNEGLYAIDVVALTSTLSYTYTDQEIAIEGLDFDPATGLLYGANDGGAYVDPTGAWGRGIVTIDLGVTPPTELLSFPYPAGENDLDGLAFDPAGKVYLIEDEPAPLHNLDVASGTYDPNPPMNAVTVVAVYSAGTYTTGSASTLGSNYCAAVANSTGAPSITTATGSPFATANDVTLRAAPLPVNAFGFFLTSRTQGFIQNPGGSQGNLCVSGSIGRYVGPGQIQNSGANGAISLAIDLTRQPTPAGFVAVQPGETWNFTAWHRDVVGGVPTSNFSDGLQIAFQ